MVTPKRINAFCDEARRMGALDGHRRIERTPQKDGRLHAVFGCGNGDRQTLTTG